MLLRLLPKYPSLQRELAPMASFLATQYKDAPTSLRKQEKNALTKSRKSKKANKEATDTSAPAPVVAAPPEPAPAVHPTPESPATPAPAAPAATPNPPAS